MDEEHEQVTNDAVSSEPNAPKPTGLRRSTKRRMVGGVAGGIGERFDIDANIVRVVFVVLTVLYGLGAAIYLAMWVLIPQAGKASDDDVDESDASPTSNLRLLRYALLAGVVVVAVIVLSTIGGAPRVGNGFAALWLIFLVVLAILSLRSSARQHFLLRFLSLVFLTGITVFILVTGAFLGFLASTGVPMHGGSGARVDQPTSLAQVQSTYETEFGTMTVDLRHVQFTAKPMSITASVGVGILRVDVPANAIVYLKTHIGAGTVTYDGRNGYEIPPFTPVPPSLKTAAQQKRAPHIDLDVEVGAGQIILLRGQ
jgi:phage shock protein PspC (stress-responsive transcriptional regulator)